MLLSAGRLAASSCRPSPRFLRGFFTAHQLPQNYEVRQVLTGQDNYTYFLQHQPTGTLACVDPGDAQLVISCLERWNLSHLDYIFLTHHHGDHTDGAKQLAEAYGCEVVGSQQTRQLVPAVTVALSPSWPPPRMQPQSSFPDYAAQTNPLNAGAMLFGTSEHPVHLIETPGHTSDHSAFWIPSANVLFAGDTLFAMGCGRLFEGSARQLYETLQKLVKCLPSGTTIFTGHEYTLENGEFALTVEPSNKILRQRMDWVRKARAQERPTSMTSLQMELHTNPFLRTHMKSVQATMHSLVPLDPVFVFEELRLRKNFFIPPWGSRRKQR